VIKMQNLAITQMGVRQQMHKLSRQACVSVISDHHQLSLAIPPWVDAAKDRTHTAVFTDSM